MCKFCLSNYFFREIHEKIFLFLCFFLFFQFFLAADYDLKSPSECSSDEFVPLSGPGNGAIELGENQISKDVWECEGFKLRVSTRTERGGYITFVYDKNDLEIGFLRGKVVSVKKDGESVTVVMYEEPIVTRWGGKPERWVTWNIYPSGYAEFAPEN